MEYCYVRGAHRLDTAINPGIRLVCTLIHALADHVAYHHMHWSSINIISDLLSKKQLSWNSARAA